VVKHARKVTRAKQRQEHPGEAPEKLGVSARVVPADERAERKRVDEALAESEQKFRAVFDQAVIGIALGTLDGRCVRANQAACNFIGVTEEEVCRLRIQDIVHPDDLGMTADRFQRLVAGEIPSYTVERRYVRRDGTIVWGRASLSVVRDGTGRPNYLVGVMADVTQEKRVENQQAAFSQLGYRLSAAVSREQAANIILEIASELFGWDAGYLYLYSEASGEIARVLTVDTVEDRRVPVPPPTQSLEPTPMMRQLMKEGGRLINRGNKSGAEPELIPFGDKQRPSASLMYVPVHSGGAVVGILSIQSYKPSAYSQDDLKLLHTLADLCGDAIERIKVTEALREAEAKYRAELERLVCERTAQLEAANESLRKQMADRERLERQMLESVEREQERIGQDLPDGLCQLLAGVKFKVASLGAKLQQKLPPEAEEIRDLEGLVNQAMRQGYGLARGLNPVEFPGRGLRLALTELASSIEAAFGVNCVCDFRTAVAIDDQATANHLYRIAQEAIHNAIKHGKPREIAISLSERGREIALAIKDDGAGFPPQAELKAGMGLQNMKARAGMIGASLEICAGESGGAVVTCVLAPPTPQDRTG
jgi:PAS domain S-box-containing protein